LKLAHGIWQNREVEYKEHIANHESQVCDVTNKNLLIVGVCQCISRFVSHGCGVGKLIEMP
jgi:hypothetical protein